MGSGGPDQNGAQGTELLIRVTRAHRARRLTLSGELTARTAPRLADHLDHASADGVDRIVVDLSGLWRLEPAGVSPLLIAHLRAAGDHRELVLIRGAEPVQQVLDEIEGPFRYLSGSPGDRRG